MKLIFLDTEFDNKGNLLEIALAETTYNYEVLDKKNWIIKPPFDSMDEFCKSLSYENGVFHEYSGLIFEIKNKWDTLLPISEIDNQVSDYLGDNMCIAAGCSVYIDLNHLKDQMPKTFSKFRIQTLDLTSLELFGTDSNFFVSDTRPTKHRALPDVEQAIKKAQIYYQKIAKKGISFSNKECFECHSNKNLKQYRPLLSGTILLCENCYPR